ncbi:unnamed protein product, partial [marine sediment metagenome]
AIFLNLSQDHLDRYGGMTEYKKAKLRIFENQKDSDCAVLDYDDSAIRKLSESIKSRVFYFSVNQKVKGSYLSGEKLFVDFGNGAEEVCRKKDINLRGTHNLKNVLAAALAAKLINREINVVAPLKNFLGLRHRFEFITEKEGVSFIDDSKSTTVDSTLKALESFRGGRVVLIAGGRDKGSDYSLLLNQIKKIKYFILIGEASEKIRMAVSGLDIPIEEALTIREAVLLSKKAARKGDSVLLSPMCSSFDMFKNYRERGEVFRKAVFDVSSICKN